MADDPKKPRATWLGMSRRRALTFATGAAVAVGSVFGMKALADSKTGQHMMLLAHDGGGWHGGWHHRGRGWRHGGFANLSDAEIEQRIDRMTKHVAIEIDATPDQQKKIAAAFVAVAKDLKPMRGQMLDARKQIRSLLFADKIDRAALEKIRTERLADIERASKQVLNAVADAAEILTPEQRKKLDQRIEEFRGRRHRWHRG